MKRRGRPKKSIQAYESEAVRVNGCLIHKTAHVARHIYQLRHGKLPTHLHVCHTCDTPLCILDRHHFKGTNLENQQDSARKGRKKAAMNRPEVRALQSKVQKQRFIDDPDEYRKSKERNNKPSTVKKRSISMKRAWKDPVIRDKLVTALSVAVNLPEEIERRREERRAYYADPKNRSLASKIQKEAKQRPEVRAAHSEGALRMWGNPEYRRRQSEAQRGKTHKSWKAEHD